MKCYQGAPSAPRRTVKSGRRLISSPVVPTLERLNTAALRDIGQNLSRHRPRARPRPQPAERVPRARRRHRHEHGAHARCRGRRDGRRCRRRPRRNLRCHQPRLAHGGAWQQRRDPQPDPAGFRRHAQASGRRAGREVRRGAAGRGRRCVRGGAQADRGHDPHRVPRERRGSQGRRRRGRVARRGRARGARRRQDGARQHARAAPGAEGGRGRRRRGSGLPAAARLGAPRRRRRTAPGGRARRRDHGCGRRSVRRRCAPSRCGATASST